MTTTPIYAATLTAQNVIDATSRETRGVLDSTVVADQTILLDYLNRTQLTVNRWTGWDFLESDWQYFMTQLEQTHYIIGNATVPIYAATTGLALTDLDRIKRNSVFDISNARPLQRVEARPYAPALSYRDSNFRPGPPREWIQDVEQFPSIIQLYPAPDNNNSYQSVPPTPAVRTVVSGALAKRTYYVRTTYVDSFGNESAASDREATLTIPANSVLVVTPPQDPLHGAKMQNGATISAFNIYASTTANAEVLQASNQVLTAAWQEPNSGLISGVAFPTTNNISSLGGYVIGFKYYRQRQVVSATSDVLQIPNVYKDVLIAGTTWQAMQYLKLKDEAQYWFTFFQQGLRDMVRDRNTIPRENDYIQPDYSGLGVGNTSQYIDTFEVQR